MVPQGLWTTFFIITIRVAPTILQNSRCCLWVLVVGFPFPRPFYLHPRCKTKRRTSYFLVFIVLQCHILKSTQNNMFAKKFDWKVYKTLDNQRFNYLFGCPFLLSVIVVTVLMYKILISQPLISIFGGNQSPIAEVTCVLLVTVLSVM